MTLALRYEVVFVLTACRTAAASCLCFYFLNSCLPLTGVITPRGMFLCSVVLGRGMFFKSVKLGVDIIQVEVEAVLVVLDSELFGCRYIQTALHAYNPRWEPRV